MESLARKVQQERQRQIVEQPKPKKQKKKSFGLTLGEKIIGIAFCAALSFGGFHIISNQAAIYDMNKNIQETRVSIQDQQRVNEDLEVQVEELSSYERILEKAKELGFEFNKNNVKVVQGE